MTVLHARRPGALIAATALAVSVLAGCGTTTGASVSTSPAQMPTLTSAPLWAPPGTAALPDATAKKLQAVLDKAVTSAGVKGLTAAVVTPNGVWSGAAGVDGAGAALQPASAMNIASITKTFTAAEVMRLASAGQVDLDAPLSRYVSLPFPDNGATVRQALAMRTGFPDLAPSTWTGTVAAQSDKVWTLQEALALIPADAKGKGTRGGPPYYNDVNYMLLGAVIEKVTGMTLAQALRRDLLDPAALSRAWVQPEEKPLAPTAIGTDPAGKQMVDAAGGFLPSRALSSVNGSAGAIAADAASVARWGYLLWGGQIIDASLVREMEANPGDEQLFGVKYGLGTMVADQGDGTPFYGHAGGSADWPYTTIVFAFSNPPQSIAVLVPEPGDPPGGVASSLHEVLASG